MIFRCVKAGETTEGTYAVTVDEGTVWMASNTRPSRGGYELVLLSELSDGTLTGKKALVRAARLSTDFEMVPPEECYGIVDNEPHASRGPNE